MFECFVICAEFSCVSENARSSSQLGGLVWEEDIEGQPLHPCSSTNNSRVVSLNSALIGNFPVIQHLPTPVHPAVMGDLEFSGVQIHWPLLVNQLRVQVGLRVPTPIS